MNWTVWIGIGSIFGALGVGLGAFGAHALKGRLSDHYLNVFEVGVRYQMYHALALLAVGFLSTRVDSSLLKGAGVSFSAGTILFSGSLYGLSLLGIKSLGMITPIGGLFFIVGWLLMGIAAFRL